MKGEMNKLALIPLYNLARNTLGLSSQPIWRTSPGTRIYDLRPYIRTASGHGTDPLFRTIEHMSGSLRIESLDTPTKRLHLDDFADLMRHRWDSSRINTRIQLALPIKHIGDDHASILRADGPDADTTPTHLMNILCRGVSLEHGNHSYHWTGFNEENNLLFPFFMARPAYASLFPLDGIYLNEAGMLTLKVRDKRIKYDLLEKAAALYSIFYGIREMELSATLWTRPEQESEIV